MSNSNSVYPYRTPPKSASDLGLHYLPMYCLWAINGFSSVEMDRSVRQRSERSTKQLNVIMYYTFYIRAA